MQTDLTLSRLKTLLSRFDGIHAVLVGDLFLDRWYHIEPSLDEPSLETGKTAHQVVKKRSAPGAGGTVLNNLSAMGAGKIEVVSAVGQDGDGWELMKLLQARGVDTSRVIVSDRIVTPSYIKPLFPEEGERLDVKNFSRFPKEIEDGLISGMQEAVKYADAVILLDQVCEENCGVLTDNVRDAAGKLAVQYPGKLFLADSRAFIGVFRNVMIKCNNYEAAFLAKMPVESDSFCEEHVFECMKAMKTVTGCSAVVTCNRYGIAVESDNGYRLIPAVRHYGPIDICGAGDATTAALSLSIAAGAAMHEAALIANLAAGVTVRKLGETGTASQEEIIALYLEQFGYKEQSYDMRK